MRAIVVAPLLILAVITDTTAQDLPLQPDLGALVGVGLGAIASVAWIASDCEVGDTSGCGGEQKGLMAAGTTGLATIGSVMGVIGGALIKSDRWEQVPLDRLRVSVVPTRRGFGIGARLAF